MGNKLASPAFHLETFVQDLAGLSIQETLCNGRLLKTVKFANDEGQLVGKIYPKRFLSESLKPYIEKLSEALIRSLHLPEIKRAFYGISNPNVFPWQNYFETERAGYLIRQFFLNNLSDRIGTRPFLSMVEKKWIAYQLLVALEQSHRLGICHGDIKCENVLCTSWNWIFLSDYAPWKPTFIPQDDPADFSFYFDTSGRRTCYLAPERFVKQNAPADSSLTPAMDIFSVGCVIAELFLEGKHIFELGELLSYVKGDYDPLPRLRRIGDMDIEQLVAHMIQRDPSQRLSADEYLHKWTGRAFPRCFTFLHTYIGRIVRRSSDDKVHTINADFNMLLSRIDGAIELPDVVEPPPPVPIERVLSSSSQLENSPSASSLDSPAQRQRGKMAADKRDLLSIAEKLLAALEGNGTPAALAEIFEHSHEDKVCEEREAVLRSTLPRPVPPPAAAKPVRQKRTAETSPLQLLLSVLCSSLHTLKSPLAKTTLLDLFVAFSVELDDDSRMQRIVPYMRLLLADSAAAVRACAIRSLTKVLDMVNNFPPSESNIFPEYIIPALSPFLQDQEDFVREVYAENLAQLAETAKRFLEKTQMVKQTATPSPDSETREDQLELPPSEASYDKELQEIQDSFFTIVSDLLTRDSSSAVQRTLLADIGRFCRFFGKQRTIEFLLPVTTTFLNHRDWELRSAFFRAIVSVSSFVGMASLEPLLPLTEDALTKHDEIVVDKALNSVAALCELGLFRKHVLFSVAKKIAPMLCHPNVWIRHGVIAAMAAIAKRLSPADTHCFLAPILRPYLLCNIVDITAVSLLDCLKPALSRRHFEQCLEKSWELHSKGAADTEQFDMAFASALSEARFPDAALETARVMRLYLRSVSISIHSSGMLSKSEKDEDDLAHIMQLFQTNTVYSVPLPPTDPNAPVPPAKDRPLLLVAPVPKGLVNPAGQLAMNGQELNFANRKTEEEASEMLPLLPPPMPDLGALRRFDNGSSTPLNGESLKQFRPKGTLVAHFHEHRGAVNQVSVSADGHFFVTGSDDFTAKVWDCLAEGTRVTLAAGIDVPIESVRPGDIVLGRALNSAGVVPREVQAVLPRGERACVELLLADGRTLTCTANHRLLTADGSWVQAADLDVSKTRLVVSLEGAFHAKDEDAARCTAWSLDLKAPMNIVLDFSDTGRAYSLAFARLCGYLLTGGHVRAGGDRNQGGELYMGHQLDVDLAVRDVRLLTSVEPTVSRNSASICVSLPTRLVSAFVDNGVERGKPTKVTHMPPVFLAASCPLPLVREYLGGLFGGDGHTLSATKNGFTGLGFSMSKKGAVAWQQVSVFRMELVPLLVRCGVPERALRVTLRAKNKCSLIAGGWAEIARAKDNGEQLTYVVEGAPLDTGTMYEVKLFIRSSGVLPFAHNIGFRYCADKQVRLTAGAAWHRSSNYIAHQHAELVRRVETIIAHEHCTIAAAISRAKCDLAKQELLHPVFAGWDATCRDDLHTSGKCMGTSAIAAKQEWEINKFFTPTRKNLRYNARKREVEMEQGEAAADAQPEDNYATAEPVVYGVQASANEYPHFFVPVIARRNVGVRRVWDLAVPSDCGDAYNSFLANGVVVHNCQRLEKNVTNRSRLTFSAQAKVKTLTMCENSHSVVVGCDNGSVQVFRIDYTSKKEGGLTRYTSCAPIKSGVERAEGPVVSVAHFNSLTQSLLAFATTKGRVHGWDLRSRKEAWLLSNPLSHGIVQDFIIDPQRNWILVGTSRGFLTCWDMRSRVPVKVWRHPSRTRILRLLPYSVAAKGTWVYIASAAEQVDVYDIESGDCKQMFRVLPAEDAPVQVRPLEPVSDSSSHSDFDFGIDDPATDNGPQNHNMRALASPAECSYLLTAGADKRVRFWDIATPANSYAVCGVDIGAPRPRYSHQQLGGPNGENVPLFREVPNTQDPLMLETANSKLRAHLPSMNHHDCILDMKMLELPHRMLISSSRDGVVKVWK